MISNPRKDEFKRETKIKAALFGATGAVGQVFMWMLSDHPWFEITRIIASESRIGKKYGKEVHWILPMEIPQVILNITISDFDMDAMKAEGIQVVFSALPNSVAETIEPQLIEAGFAVFSNAAAMRYQDNVPILIPEANIDSLNWIEKQGYPEKGFIVTNANCSTTGLAVAMAPLKKFGIKEDPSRLKDQIEKLDLREGDTVFVEKGGEIIPKVVAVDVKQRDLFSQPTTYIKNCPECDTELVRQEGEAVHYCPNEVGRSEEHTSELQSH